MCVCLSFFQQFLCVPVFTPVSDCKSRWLDHYDLPVRSSYSRWCVCSCCFGFLTETHRPYKTFTEHGHQCVPVSTQSNRICSNVHCTGWFQATKFTNSRKSVVIKAGLCSPDLTPFVYKCARTHAHMSVLSHIGSIFQQRSVTFPDTQRTA